MKFRRALVVHDDKGDPALVASSLARVAPRVERVLIVGVARNSASWWSGDGLSDPVLREVEALERWRDAISAAGLPAEPRIVPHPVLEALTDLALAEDADLLVGAGRTLGAARLIVEAGRRLGIAALWPVRHGGAATEAVGRSAQQPPRVPARHVFCVATGHRSQAVIASFLRVHGDPSLDVSVVGPSAADLGDVAAAMGILGVRGHVRLLEGSILTVRSALDEAGRERPVDLVVLSRAPAMLLDAYPWPAPVLVAPPTKPLTLRPGVLDVTDAVDLRGTIRARLYDVTAAGSLVPASNAVVGLVADGYAMQTAITSSTGDVELGEGATAPDHVGLARMQDDEPPDVVAAAKQRFAVVRPTNHPLVLFDAELSSDRLSKLAATLETSTEPLAVRLRPTSRASTLRERARAAGIQAPIVDAAAVLDEGDAFDVTNANDPVRLRRVARRLRDAGFSIAAVYDGSSEPTEIPGDGPSATTAGNRVDIELDNTQARRWLLEAIAESSRSVLVQVYMALDDEIGRTVEAALATAAARGVAIRVLVDSLHGLHGSFGTEHPLFARLAARPGIEVLTLRPVNSLPSVTDLKQRDHRKIVVIDDRVALVGGRNLSHEYYTGFDEVRLEASTPWRRVPWLDAGARIEGPAVADIASAFREAWIDAAGAPFPIERPPPMGSTSARVVVHRGLEDAATLETYRELIDGARSHLVVVNGFPFVLELEHALLRALERGVRVRVVTGHLTPMHGETRFTGPWAAARTTATELVHSRLDAIVDAGGDVYLYARPSGPLAAPDLGPISPHVHAKLLSVDGRFCAVGSANFDVTSAYWESELMIVVDDPAVVQRVEETLDGMMAGSTRIDREDQGWRERARRRAWMRRWPGQLAG